MTIKKSEIDFNFKNQFIEYQSNLKGFDHKIFNKFNQKSEDLNLFKKIKDLKDGKEVNATENKPAIHMQQREEYSSADNIQPNTVDHNLVDFVP